MQLLITILLSFLGLLGSFYYAKQGGDMPPRHVLGLLLAAGAALGILIHTLHKIIHDQQLTQHLNPLMEEMARSNQNAMTKSKTNLQDLILAFKTQIDQLNESLQQKDIAVHQLSDIVDTLDEAILVMDDQLKVIQINESAGNLFGLKLPLESGKTLLQICLSTDIENSALTTLQQDSPLTKEFLYQNKQGPKTLGIHLRCLHSKNSPRLLLAIFKDITELAQLKNSRSDLVANVSHEFRTPLTSITGFIETLLESPQLEESKRHSFLKLMQQDASRLNRLILDLLEITRIESGKLTLKKTKLLLGNEIDYTLSILKKSLESKHIHVINKLLDIPEIHFKGDRDKLQQVWINLIDNAIKFNEEGGSIEINATATDSTLNLCILNTGTCISSEAMAHVFERFYRTDKDRSRQQGGTGLGLAIVKHVIEVHKGSVTCQSNPKTGITSFIVHLPLHS